MNKLHTEILAEFERYFGMMVISTGDSTYVGTNDIPENIKNFLSKALTRQLDHFLTMLPPENKILEDELYFPKYDTGWNDYRKELLTKLREISSKVAAIPH